ncbi:MAG: sugar phosphate nucleotidyltransferase [Sediminibacterium sp.]|jgi:N-acetyl-alpha-D-muramate 1-phosphate uridylyltransferase|nr:NTP transferase domain-containing protein [Chitinophagaceae bacterium]MCA6447770.1 NTP transferase domain-containing protein [Chitinophagaceae bacterium]
MRAMIFAAGLGTRLKPFTDHHPKALAMVNGKSLLERNVVYLQNQHIFEVIVNVHHFADQIIEAISSNNGWGSNITISDETDVVLETGGGLMKAKPYLEDESSFVVMNADILTDMPLHSMIAMHEKNKPLATLAVSDRQSSRCLLFDDKNKMIGWRNKITGDQKGVLHGNAQVEIKEKAFSGIHIINSDIFKKNNFEGKFSMIDLYLDLCTTNSIQAYDHTGSLFIDVGKPENIAMAEKLFP